MFQQRHFETLARMMQDLHPGLPTGKPGHNADRHVQWLATRDEMVRLFLRHNERFDSGRFTAACEPGANVRARKAA